MKSVQTITIIDNDNGTQHIYISNADNKNMDIEIKKGISNFTVNDKINPCLRSLDLFKSGYFHQDDITRNVEINLNIKCLSDRDNKFLSYSIPMKDIKDITNKELIEELKNRNVLLEESIYTINLEGE